MALPKSGASSWCMFGWETAYATVTTQFNKAFGHGIKISNLNRKNNVERVKQIGARNTQKLVPLAYEGAVSVEFILSSPWIFKGILGATTVSGTQSPYTHTFSEADTIPSVSIENDIATDTPIVAKMIGGKMKTTTLTIAVGRPVMVKMDIPYANETIGTSTTAQVNESFDLFTYANTTMQLPSGSTISLVQNAEITFENGSELLKACGSRFAQNSVEKDRDYTIKTSVPLQILTDLLQKFTGGATGPVASPAETATMVFTLDNGLTGSNQRQIAITFTGLEIDEDSLPSDPTAPIVEDVTLFARSCGVTAINGTSACP